MRWHSRGCARSSCVQRSAGGLRRGRWARRHCSCCRWTASCPYLRLFLVFSPVTSLCSRAVSSSLHLHLHLAFRSVGRATVCAALSSSHGYKQLMPWLGRRMALGANVAGKGKGESRGRVISSVRRSCRQAAFSTITSTVVPRPSGGMRYIGGVRRARSLSLTLQDAETKRTPG